MRRIRFGLLILAAAVGGATPAAAESGATSEPPPSLEYRPPRPVITEPKAPHPAPPMTIFREIVGRFGMMTGSFDGPSDIARDESGNFYVLDSGNKRIQLFDSRMNFVASLGKYGYLETDSGEFIGPEAIAVNKNGVLYVVDTGNDRVQVFDWVSSEQCPECPSRRDGKRLKRVDGWGRTGIREGEFKSPKDIAFDDDGNVFIVDSGNDRVQLFTGAGEFIREWERSSFGVTGGVFTDLKSIAYSNERFGSFYLLGAGCVVQQFKLDGTLLNSWPAIAPESGLCVPGRIEIDDRYYYVYVLDAGNSLLSCFNPDGLYRWALRGAQVPFAKPRGFAVNASGEEFLVADTENNIVQKFTLR